MFNDLLNFKFSVKAKTLFYVFLPNQTFITKNALFTDFVYTIKISYLKLIYS